MSHTVLTNTGNPKICYFGLVFCIFTSLNSTKTSSTFSVLRPLYFDLLSNLQLLLVEKNRSTVLLEVKFRLKSVGRSTEKVEDMKMVEVHKRSN